MRHRPKQRGFTIIETLIFLTVSASVFGAAIVQYTGQQHSGEFTQGVRGFQSQLELLQNEVASTYTADISGSGYRCLANNFNTKPTFPAGGPTADSSSCVFLGRAFGFGNTTLCTPDNSADCSRYVTVPIVARRQTYTPAGGTSSVPAATLFEGKPLGLATCTTLVVVSSELPCGFDPLLPVLSTRPNLADRSKLKNGIGIYKAFVRTSTGAAMSVPVKNTSGAPLPPSTTIGAIAYLLSFNQSGIEATPAVNLLWLPTQFVNNTEQSTIRSIDNLGGASAAEEASYTNPTYGIALCLYGAYGQQAEIILGANNNPADVKIQPNDSLDSGC